MDKGQKKDKGLYVDAETRQYLDDFKREIMETIRETTRILETHIKELITSTINPIQNDIERLRKNDETHYNNNLKMVERVGDLEGDMIKDGEKRLSKLEENKDGRQNRMGIIIGVTAIVMTLVVGLFVFL